VRLDRETREYVRREIDRVRRIEIETLSPAAERWSRGSILEAVRAFEAMVGRPPRRSDFDDPETLLPSARTTLRFFGSIGETLDAALPPRPVVEIETYEQATLFEVA